MYTLNPAQVLEDGPAPATECERARVLLMGDGTNRWYDKSIQVTSASLGCVLVIQIESVEYD